jgi:hypothetical protein
MGRRFLPLTPDTFFYITAANALPAVFMDFHGALSASGTATAKLMIPNAPPLVGIKAYTAFVTYPAPTGVNVISNPLTFMIEK